MCASTNVYLHLYTHMVHALVCVVCYSAVFYSVYVPPVHPRHLRVWLTAANFGIQQQMVCVHIMCVGICTYKIYRMNLGSCMTL